MFSASPSLRTARSSCTSPTTSCIYACMSEPQGRPIPGTLEPTTPAYPVFSPDGQSVAFFSGADQYDQEDRSERRRRHHHLSGDTASGMSGTMAGSSCRVQQRHSARLGERRHDRRSPASSMASLHSGRSCCPAATGCCSRSRRCEERRLGQGGDRRAIAEDGRTEDTHHRRQRWRYCRLDTSCTPSSGVLFAVPFDRRTSRHGRSGTGRRGCRASSTGTWAATHFSISSTGSLVFVPGRLRHHRVAHLGMFGS